MIYNKIVFIIKNIKPKLKVWALYKNLSVLVSQKLSNLDNRFHNCFRRFFTCSVETVYSGNCGMFGLCFFNYSPRFQPWETYRNYISCENKLRLCMMNIYCHIPCAPVVETTGYV